MSSEINWTYSLILCSIVMAVAGFYLLSSAKSIDEYFSIDKRAKLANQIGDQSKKDSGALNVKPKHISTWRKTVSASNRQGTSTDYHISLLLIGASLFIFLLLFLIFDQITGIRAVIRTLLSLIGTMTILITARKIRANRREQDIEEQLADTVESLVRSLKVGHPFSTAFQSAANETPSPLGDILRSASEELSYGGDLGETLAKCSQKIGTQDFRFLTMTINIHRTSGGNLTEVLAGLSSLIRARLRLKRRIRTITAEAKLSGGALSIFPIAALALITVVKPDFYSRVYQSDYFYFFCAGVLGMLVLNLILMNSLTNIKS